MAAGPTRLVLGLGNPGTDYAGTRHNLGFVLADRLASALCASFGRRGRVRVARAGRRVVAKPTTFMNRSGRAARDLLADLGEALEWLVVCDDVHLPLGRARCRAGGSDGGHNGLASVLTALGTREVPRLRLGVGEPPGGVPREDFVLEPFHPDERADVEAMLDRVEGPVLDWLADGDLERLVARVNAPPEPA